MYIQTRAKSPFVFYLSLLKISFISSPCFDIGHTSQFSKQSPRIIRKPDNLLQINQESTVFLFGNVVTFYTAHETSRLEGIVFWSLREDQ
jgi:hypothetical protein